MSSNEREVIVAELSRLADQIRATVSDMGAEPDERDYLEYRARLGELQASFEDKNNELSRSLGMTSAKARILAYLQLHLGEVVSSGALAGVAGISAFQRRIRELRLDDGYDISSMDSRADLKPGEYILQSRRRTPRP
jgi:hypothetical protein